MDTGVTTKQATEVTALSTLSAKSFTPQQKNIMESLTAMAILRGAELPKTYLALMAVRLSRENFDRVLKTIEVLAESERQEGENTLPTLGRILKEIAILEEAEHPPAYAHLRGLVRKMARNWGVKADDEMLRNFEEICGHRTDVDMDTAYAALMKDETQRRMPACGQFLAACGVMRERRDGAKVA